MNNRKKLKPQVKVALIFVGIIIACILLENIINGIGLLGRNIKSKIEYNEKQEIKQESPQYQKGLTLTDFVNEMMAYLAEGNYEEVYAMTDPEYLEVFSIDSVDKFKTVVNEYLGGSIPKEIQMVDYYVNGDRYLCEMLVEKEDLIENINIIVKARANGGYYIVIDDIKSIEKYNKKYRFANSQYEYDIKYKVRKGTEKILIIEAQNKTSNNLVGSLALTTLEKSNRAECSVKNSEEVQKISFPAGEIVKFSLVFPNDKYALYQDESLNLKVQFEDGSNIDRSINMVPIEAY